MSKDSYTLQIQVDGSGDSFRDVVSKRKREKLAHKAPELAELAGELSVDETGPHKTEHLEQAVSGWLDAFFQRYGAEDFEVTTTLREGG